MPSSLGHLRIFSECPHMRKEPFCACSSRKTSGFRMSGQRCGSAPGAEQRVALIIRPNMIKAASQRPSECHARMSIRKAFGERPHMSMKGFFAQDAQKRPGMRMGGALRERACAQQCVALIMIKATRKVDANAELARAFADIFRVPTHEEGAVLRMFFAQNERIPNEWAAMRERPWRGAARRFNHTSKHD